MNLDEWRGIAQSYLDRIIIKSSLFVQAIYTDHKLVKCRLDIVPIDKDMDSVS